MLDVTSLQLASCRYFPASLINILYLAREFVVAPVLLLTTACWSVTYCRYS